MHNHRAMVMWMLICWHNYNRFVFQKDSILPDDIIPPFYKSWTLLDATLMNVVVANLTCISFERYFAIAMPLLHRIHLTSGKKIIPCVATWLLSIAIIAPALAYENGSMTKYIHKAGPVLVCCIAIIASYVILLQRLHSNTRRNRQVWRTNNNRSEAILHLRLSLLTVVFLFCWTLITIFSFWAASHNAELS